jgi:hypothetical protein
MIYVFTIGCSSISSRLLQSPSMYTARLPSCIELPFVIELSPSSLSPSSVSSQRSILNYKMKSQKQPLQEGENLEKVTEGEKTKKLSSKECE